MSAQCSICDAPVELQEGVEVSEVVTCADCGSRLVVESITNHQVLLAQAPAIEEDWGE
jgi:lysine biosynthesis protein LysW